MKFGTMVALVLLIAALGCNRGPKDGTRWKVSCDMGTKDGWWTIVERRGGRWWKVDPQTGQAVGEVLLPENKCAFSERPTRPPSS